MANIEMADTDEQIGIVRENLRELMEQATAYSGSADEEMTAQRISEQQGQLELLLARRDVIASRTGTAGIRRNEMSEDRIKEHMEVIGADGVHIGTVDRVENGRIKLTRADGGEGRHKGHHHFIDIVLVADVEGQQVRLSANADVAVTFEEEE